VWNEGEMRTNFLFQNSDGRDHMGDLRTDGKIILKNLREMRYVAVDWIHLVLWSCGYGNDI
jgi:hypothetical protein